MRINGMVMRGEVTWASLPAPAKLELDEALAMMTEASDQGHLVNQGHSVNHIGLNDKF